MYHLSGNRTFGWVVHYYGIVLPHATSKGLSGMYVCLSSLLYGAIVFTATCLRATANCLQWYGADAIKVFYYLQTITLHTQLSLKGDLKTNNTCIN